MSGRRACRTFAQITAASAAKWEICVPVREERWVLRFVMVEEEKRKSFVTTE
jgi:hypothetical protein